MLAKLVLVSMLILTAAVIVIAAVVNIFSQFKLSTKLFPGLNLRDLGLRYKVKPSMLCLTRPDIFIPEGRVYQRWYAVSFYTFLAAFCLILVELYFLAQFPNSNPGATPVVKQSTDTYLLSCCESGRIERSK